LKARIVERKEAVIARQHHIKHISLVMNKRNNRRTVGSDVFYAVNAEVILIGPACRGYTYRDLALQVKGNLESETVEYGRESRRTRT
jgi:hypothetical protein